LDVNVNRGSTGVFVAALLAVTVPNLQAAPSGVPWFPLQPGNQWVLTATNGDTRTIQCDTAPRGNSLVTGLFDEPVILRSMPGFDGNLVGRISNHGRWQTLFRFGRITGRSWPFNLTGDGCGNSRASWAAMDNILVTPADTFTGCRHWQSVRAGNPTNDCPASATVDLWLAPRVGPVALQSEAGELFLLTSATVGSRTYPPPTNGLDATLTTDQSVYTNIANHLVICPSCTTNVPPCEVPCFLAGGTNATAAFHFQVLNASTEPKLFFFPTGQRFDIQLIDSNAVVVADWAYGKAFPQFATTVTLPPGGTLSYDATMELVTRAGDALSGDYIARAFLTNAGPTATNTNGPGLVEATAPFRVILLLPPTAIP